MYNKSYFYPVINKDKYKTATSMYYLCKTNSASYLFTDSDLKKAVDRADSNPEDLLDESLFYNENDSYNSGYYKGLFLGSLIAFLMSATVFGFSFLFN